MKNIKMFKLLLKQNSGFTLIELIVVIAIIGIISAIGVSSYVNYLKVARDAVRLSHMNEVVKALRNYRSLYGMTPNTSSYGEANTASGGTHCGSWDSSGNDFDGDGRPFVEFLYDRGLLTSMVKDPNEKTSSNGPGPCGNYDFYTYSSGSYECDASKGRYWVVGIRDLESIPAGSKHPSNPGFACGNRIWTNEFEWVMGEFEF